VNGLRHTEAFLLELQHLVEVAGGDGPLADERTAKTLRWCQERLEAAMKQDREADDPKLTPLEAHAKYGVSKRQLRRLPNYGKPFKPLYAESDVAACRPRARQEALPEHQAHPAAMDAAELLREQIRERRRLNRASKAA
jgi:hypothetical protein